jgi:tRNA 5-methylaminomethyl-2-thiouridine biosynthesis bifunctional protein
MSDDIHWNDQGQPVSTQFDDIYFSTDDGLAETQYVFLQANALEERFEKIEDHATFVIAETGFGTGLNFLAACQLWGNTANPTAHLHFISVEKYPLEKAAIQRALSVWPELRELHEFQKTLLENYPSTISGFHRIVLSHNISLTLIIDDAVSGFQQLMASPSTRNTIPHTMPPLIARQWQGVDAWFLDGFAPSKNPDMWSDDLFNLMFQLSHTQTTFSTFTAAGIVRRGLAKAGFSIEKLTGYGHKREMIRGNVITPVTPEAKKNIATDDRAHSKNTAAHKKHQPKNYQYTVDAWALSDQYKPTPIEKTIAIIGGGIAGCHTAYALAQKGYKVTIFDKANTLATGASGNSQGIVYAKLSAAQEPQGDINLYSLLYAQRFYRHYWRAVSNNTAHGEQCGVMQLSLTDKLQHAHHAIAQRFPQENEDICYLSAAEASGIANTSIQHPALFFPKAGWIDPRYLCEWLSTHDNISISPHSEVTQLEPQNQQWLLHIKNAQAVPHSELFDTVVITNAYDALQLSQSQYLPLKRVRGQVTHYPATPVSSALKTAICGKGYIAPAQDNHCLGASFNLGITDTALNPSDHQNNLENIAQQVPDMVDMNRFSDSAHLNLSGRVGFRCVTPYYLPIVGGIPVESDVQHQYQVLKHNAKQTLPCASHYHSNLFINVGHGSRGLAYTPLCSEILASLIHGDPPPIPQALLQKLSPTRFIIRDLIRTR